MATNDHATPEDAAPGDTPEDIIQSRHALLLADVHLQTEQPQVTARFMHCLEHELHGVEQLFILGDLFEAWLGDDMPGMLGDQLIAEFSKLAQRGVEIYFMHGNRDFLLGQDYALQAGMRLLPEPTIISHAGRRLLLAHGDAWCSDDHDYQALRQQVRNPQWQREFLALPKAQRLAMAAQARSASQQHTAKADAGIMDVNEDVIAEIFAQYEVDTIIHGHTHRPDDHHYGKQVRYVLGAWHTQSSWLRLCDGRLERHGKTLKQLASRADGS